MKPTTSATKNLPQVDEREAEQKPTVTFLLGAGLMAEVLPMSIDLTNRFKDHLSTTVPDHGEQKRLAQYLQVYRFLAGGIRFQQGVMNKDPDVHVNIEQLATAALRLKSRQENPVAAYASGWHQRLLDLEANNKELLGGFLDEIYSMLEEWLTVGTPEKFAYLTKLLDFQKHSQRVDLFTLNYDLCIEKAFAEIKQGIPNGFTEGCWQPALLQNATLRLFKLHGSLDWVDDELRGICSLQFPRHPQAEDFEGQRPLLIFGTDTKLTGKEPFLTLLYHFSFCLNSTDVLIVIGYSFGDDYLNEVIKQRMRGNTKLRIIVVSPHATAKVASVDFLQGSPRVIPIDSTAKDALNDNKVLRRFLELSKATADELPW